MQHSHLQAYNVPPLKLYQNQYADPFFLENPGGTWGVEAVKVQFLNMGILAEN